MTGIIHGKESSHPLSDQNWIKVKESKPLFLRVIKAVTFILKDLYNKQLITTDQKILLSAFIPANGNKDISMEEITTGCQNILKSIFYKCPEKSFHVFPQAVKDAIQLKVDAFKEKIEQLNPNELFYVPQGNFQLNLLSEKRPSSKPASKIQVLRLLKNFVQNNSYIASQLQESFTGFFDKFLETKDWSPEIDQVEIFQFGQTIQEALECADFLTQIHPGLKARLLDVFRAVARSSLWFTNEEILRRVLPKLAVLTKVSELSLQDIPAVTIEMLKKIFSDTQTSLPNKESCYALLSACVPNFVNQKITISLANDQQNTLNPLQCALLRNTCDLLEKELTIALPEVSAIDFVEFWALIISQEKRCESLTLNKWCAFFDIAALLKIFNLDPLFVLLTEEMFGNTIESFISSLHAINACITKHPRYAADCVKKRDLLISAFLRRLKIKKEDLEPYFAVLQSLNTAEADDLVRFQTIYVRQLTYKMITALAQFRKQPALVFVGETNALQPNFFAGLPRLKKLTTPDNWKFENLKASASLEFLIISFALDSAQQIGELLNLYPRLRELHLVQSPAFTFTINPEIGEQYPKLKILINNQEVFKGKEADLPATKGLPLLLKRVKKRHSTSSSEAKRYRPTYSRKPRKRKAEAEPQPPTPAAALQSAANSKTIEPSEIAAIFTAVQERFFSQDAAENYDNE